VISHRSTRSNATQRTRRDHCHSRLLHVLIDVPVDEARLSTRVVAAQKHRNLLSWWEEFAADKPRDLDEACKPAKSFEVEMVMR
jgi:hypothetical protein